MFARLFKLSRAEASKRAGELLERFDLADAAGRPARTYSGGMRRRLDLASSLVTRPQVLFLDEPTTGLDPRSRIEIWASLRELQREGTTLLLTTQYLEEADELADRIAVIDHGTVIAEGTGSELKDRVGGQLLEVELAAAADLLDDSAGHVRVAVRLRVRGRDRGLNSWGLLVRRLPAPGHLRPVGDLPGIADGRRPVAGSGARSDRPLPLDADGTLRRPGGTHARGPRSQRPDHRLDDGRRLSDRLPLHGRPVRRDRLRCDCRRLRLGAQLDLRVRRAHCARRRGGAVGRLRRDFPARVRELGFRADRDVPRLAPDDREGQPGDADGECGALARADGNAALAGGSAGVDRRHPSRVRAALGTALSPDGLSMPRGRDIEHPWSRISPEAGAGPAGIAGLGEDRASTRLPARVTYARARDRLCGAPRPMRT